MQHSGLALSLKGVSKKYMIARRRELTDDEDQPGNRFRRTEKEVFWAVKDVSFDVQRGDVVGIIGKNGAGKSTLLKVLSRITEPTAGVIDVYGRIGSLLEVGTGFHPELTGRENVFLNGAILGMRRSEIAGRFDAIVEFSGVERFLDTPVKRYSSGMYVRLAFAVAAHLDPEILVVDEVLAVGDAEFQRKCLGKMRDVASDGRTVLFVSHNLSVVSSVCNRAVLMQAGRVAESGPVNAVISRYHSMTSGDRDVSLDRVPRSGLGNVRFTELILRPRRPNGEPGEVVYEGDDLEIDLELECHREVVQATVAVIIYDPGGFRLIDINTAIKRRHISMLPGERRRLRFVMKGVRLRAGDYPVGLWAGRHGVENYDDIEFAGSFEAAGSLSGDRQAELYPGPYTCGFDLELEPLRAEAKGAGVGIGTAG